ncbi:MAG: signal recognition particle-docking protein FtsY, partial [Flavobacteriales bacterium]|nr:signal recognition particle-docking protein FtsY [Flavobacteriales bacterium]
MFGLFSKEKKGTPQDAERLSEGLERSREGLFGRLARAVAGKSTVDAAVLDELEEVLVSSDVGVETTLRIIERIEARVKRDKYVSTSELNGILREEVAALMKDPVVTDGSIKPYVIMVVGVNGTGKTTTIAKLANRYKSQGRSVLLAAGDTFRAAAIEQLEEWCRRIGVELVKHRAGADPGAVAFDALQAARARKVDVLIIDTAGRLHTKVNLMEELKKIQRVLRKSMPDAPHQNLLVLDANTGQNALSQARQFIDAVGIDGIVLTKLDGTA